jgi:formylglycine-generating enzyme required for sulfatase activity
VSSSIAVLPTPKPSVTQVLTSSSSTPRAGDTRTFAPDNAPMMFVPAGEFTMGSDSGDSDEKPVHIVYLDAFWMDKFEATNAKYSECMKSGACGWPKLVNTVDGQNNLSDSKLGNYPVIYVTWNDASKYCQWAGKRLPTEAEWEKAARGTDARLYPWGNILDKRFLNFPIRGSREVGLYPSGASPYGVEDMAGNVWEWVADWYDANYYANSPRNNPKGPESGQYHVSRGGSWLSQEGSVRSTTRGHPDYPDGVINTVGFRCARSP